MNNGWFSHLWQEAKDIKLLITATKKLKIKLREQGITEKDLKKQSVFVLPVSIKKFKARGME